VNDGDIDIINRYIPTWYTAVICFDVIRDVYLKVNII